MEIKHPISERKVQANRANAKRSTGPRTEVGKAASRRNALKHGIFSRSVDSPNLIPGFDSNGLNLSGTSASDVLGSESALQEISHVWGKLARVVVFENDCAQRPGGLENNVRLIRRYERMLTKRLHARIRECTGLDRKSLKSLGRSL